MALARCGCILAVTLLCALGAAAPDASQSCARPDDVSGPSMMQQLSVRSLTKANFDASESLSKLAPDFEPESDRSAAADARFLMQASFGPTRGSLDALSQTTYEQWVTDQMQLPVESHREYYRSRVNPAFKPAYPQKPGKVGTPCQQGSRWHSFAFAFKDVGDTIFVNGTDAILVGGVLRTLIKPHPLASSWTGMAGYTGHICYVYEELGGEVAVSTDISCRTKKKYMKNPAIWMPSAQEADFNFLPTKRGVVVLGESPASCALDQQLSSGGPLIIKIGGEPHHYDPRIRLLDNVPEKPSGDVLACVPLNAINEKSCRVALVPDNSAVIQGLTVEVTDAKEHREKYISQGAGPTVAVLLDEEVFHATSEHWRGFPMTSYFAARWTGSLKVAAGGAYDFSLESTGRSRLYIDSAEVVNNDGPQHSMKSASGSASLTAGSHNITVEFYTDRHAGIILSWQGPDSNDQKVTVPPSAFSTVSQGQSRSGCPVSCGSPFEVANDPAAGNQLPMFTYFVDGRHAKYDEDLDNRYVDRMSSKLAKGTVWTMKALEADDQLRQRVAWAMSQIFVVSVQGISKSYELTEMWLNYYDIFVRNAFGNFKDVLREVTFSPVMGAYLTHSYSKSFDYSGRVANENYAREIMQLFTIGLDMLSKGGIPQVGADGKAIGSYTNDNIMNFARVFTGFVNQPGRRNTEFTWSSVNHIDPMDMRVSYHDIYPKVDLDGGFIGDGHPLCSDALPPGSFLAKGAKYEYRPLLTHSNALVLEPQSALLRALCTGGQCGSVYSVELSETLQCSGNECAADTVSIVKVGAAFYEYIPPPCVHKFLPDPTPNETSEEPLVPTLGYCHFSSGSRRRIGHQLRLDNKGGDTPERRAECLQKCQKTGATGCQMWAHRTQSRGYCNAIYGVKEPFVGQGRSDTLCWYFNQTGRVGQTYMRMKKGKECPAGTEITSIKECQAAFDYLGMKFTSTFLSWRCTHHYPAGCSASGTRMYWNTMLETKGYSNRWVSPICRASITVDFDGQLVPENGHSRFPVKWLDGMPTPGLHSVKEQTQTVFSTAPLSAAEAKARLSLGAHRPAGSCHVCTGEVRAYHGPGGALSAETVFEVDGRFYKNEESILVLPDGKRLCRNPPVFMRSTQDPGAKRAALAEVDATLEHLFRHPNTPVFISKRLIQRFGSSNPSPTYVEAVVDAFKSGTYNGKTYSGRYGDLGATVAAILLHPEARELKTNEATTTDGALREPMLKIMHLMRSMEYKDADESQVVFAELHDVVGQFPYNAPSVFNYYHADFDLPMRKPTTMPEPEPEPEAMPEPEPEAEPEPEPEAEPEPEPEPAKSVFGPEFEIFTPPYMVGYLNGMSNLIKSGVSSECSGGKSLGTYVTMPEEGRWRQVCPQGRLTWPGAEEQNQTLQELDILLTGGRLTPVAKEVVKKAYEVAPPGQELQAAQQALVMTAEFNTLGAPLPKPGPRPPPPADQSSSKKPYKAFIVLFLHGGADTWNMLVPQECGLYQEYRDIRTDLALNPNELLKIETDGQQCEKFGIHARLPFLKGLYDAGEAAFMTNVGNLVEPTTKQSYKDGSAQRCRSMFSHSDQQTGAQTLKCQDQGTTPGGSGGRIADALALGSQKYKTTSFAFSNVAWSKARTVRRQIIGESGSPSFTEYEEWMEAIGNITSQQHGNVYSEAYADTFLNAIEETTNLGSVFENAKLLTNYDTRSSRLKSSLSQVAKLIAAREGRGAERDVFFVYKGGWDMHSNMKASLSDAFGDVDEALRGFVTEMKAQKIWDNVVLATSSEFARTLDSNGGGSDHAWAGQHLVVGGSVKGKRVFNTFPKSLKAGNERDLGRGRLVPEYPWESMLVPIAEWMGVEAGDRDTAFPNLINFNVSSHIIPRDDLFKP